MASSGSDLSKLAITAVALPADDSSFTGALPGDRVAGSRLGAHRKTLTGIAGVLTLGTVVVFLQSYKTEIFCVIIPWKTAIFQQNFKNLAQKKTLDAYF